MSEKIVLIGAGSAQFGLGTLGDVLQCATLEGCTVCLHDIDAGALKSVEEVAKRHIKDNGLSYQLTATTDRKEALKNATFCIISIEVGNRFTLWEQDWRIPQQYGIRQVYGENGGPGGLFHALRIVPPILEICEDIQRICPNATIFNYSNPMSRICTTVHRKFPDLKFIGLCHEIKSLENHLPHILETPLENIRFRAGGLNHFSVLLEVAYRDSGRDAYPTVREKAPGYFKNIWNLEALVEPGAQAERQAHDPTEWSERGLFKLILEKFNYLPITTDSHFGEYIQWAYEVVDHRGILDFFNWYKDYCSQKKAHSIQTEHYEERVVPIIEGLLTDSGEEEVAVNLPNRGPLIDDLPEFLVVEVPGILTGQGIEGIKLEKLPKGILGLLSNQVAVHDLTAEAILRKSRDVALQALLVDPVVDSVRAAEQSLDTIIDLQKRYLGYLK